MAVQAVFGGVLVDWSDIDAGPIAVMTKHHPGKPNLGDLKLIDWCSLEPADILTAGYPCQPFSNAGKRQGIDDPRHIWPWIFEGIGVLRPRLVVLENVSAHLRRGFDVVSEDLASIGYDTAWSVVSAASVGAPHLRKRLFIVAEDTHSSARGERWQPAPRQAESRRARADAGGRGGVAAPDPAGAGRHEGRPESAGLVGGSAPADGRGDTAAYTDSESGREQSGWISGSSGSDTAVARQYGEAAADTEGQRLDSRGLPLGAGAPVTDPGVGGESASGPVGVQDWVQYSVAVRRWERILGRVAPAPTVLSDRYVAMVQRRKARLDRRPVGMRGSLRKVWLLNPRFVEFMMGLPAGHVTDVEGLSRNEQLHLLGNGVVPQQAAFAIRGLVSRLALPAAV